MWNIILSDRLVASTLGTFPFVESEVKIWVNVSLSLEKTKDLERHSLIWGGFGRRLVFNCVKSQKDLFL